MTNRELLKKLVIESIHGKKWKEIKKNVIKETKDFQLERLLRIEPNFKNNIELAKKYALYTVDKDISLPSITLGRVMQALKNKHKFDVIRLEYQTGYFVYQIEVVKYLENTPGDYKNTICQWQLTKDGVECTDDNQNDETINSLIKLLKD